MEAIALVALIGTCTTLAGQAASAAKRIDTFITRYRKADRSLASLRTKLLLFSESLDQLQQWLDQTSVVSQDLKTIIKLAMDDCEVVLGELQGYVVAKVKPTEREKKVSFATKMTHLWVQSALQQEDQRLNSQLQTVILLISLVKQNNTERQNKKLQEVGARKVIRKAFDDAETIRSSRCQSLNSTVRGTNATTSFVHYTGDPELELEANDELFTSGPCVAHYRALVRGALLPTLATFNSRQVASVERDKAPTDPQIDDLKTVAITRPILKASIHLTTKALMLNYSQRRQLAVHLVEACKTSDLEWAKTLLARGASVNIITEPYFQVMIHTPLTSALSAGCVELTELLLLHGADVEARNKNGQSPLLIATNKVILEYGDISMIALLVRGGADVNSEIATTTTPLILATQNSRLDIVDYLLNQGADPNLSLEKDEPPLLLAMRNKSEVIARRLLRAGADPNYNTGGYPWGSLLRFAIGTLESTHLVRLLIEFGADVNLVHWDTIEHTIDGLVLYSCRPLHVAVVKNTGQFIKVLYVWKA
ncbi:ankyrin repeat-containing domain protein [Bombardia bombarda]|uniref:Ankyrin repeat-containing domain protein n=1 Tax=Bombardia bombarda TaxID=252184 RepID=A0AA39TW24_9PEZI|nr:ankyrin repeat-containing domain protein [Bombardia bombarda]